MPKITHTCCVSAEQQGRIDQIVRTLTELSHSKVRGLFDHGCVSLNDEVCEDYGEEVHSGDNVTICYDPQQGYKEKKHKEWVDRTFTIVYEDRHLIVVNKSANVLTVETDQREQTTLATRVSHYLKKTGNRYEAFVAHRLDRGVSGLLVFAKSPQVLTHLHDQFKRHKPERRYIAIVAGHLKESEGTFRSYLQTGNNLDQFSTRDESKGKLAITHYRVLKQLADTTVVEVQLETGRRNQIRVHFADVGHPVLGDPRYQTEMAQHERWPKNRIALHAISLGLEHPVTKKTLTFEAPLPNLMRRFIGK